MAIRPIIVLPCLSVFNITTASVMLDKPLLQEILRRFVAYGNVSVGYRGLFVTLVRRGGAWGWLNGSGLLGLYPAHGNTFVPNA